jgi:hypothetical protein
MSLQLGAAGGLFLSSAPGGLFAPMLGALFELSGHALAPYVGFDVGAGFTGSLLRPFARGLCGFEFPLSDGFWIGPRLGLGLVLQRAGVGYSSDAISGWLGVSLAFRTPTAAGPRPALTRAARPPTAAESAALSWSPLPPPEHPPLAPSPALTRLLDQAVQVEHSELLAPVLFPYDSSEPEPSGIAMLHEVARLLNGERSDIARLQIAAYYNRALALRRAAVGCSGVGRAVVDYREHELTQFNCKPPRACTPLVVAAPVLPDPPAALDLSACAAPEASDCAHGARLPPSPVVRSRPPQAAPTFGPPTASPNSVARRVAS